MNARRSFACVLLPLLAACTLVQLADDSRQFYDATVLVGRVAAPPGWDGPVVVGVVGQDRTQPIVHHVWLHEPGGYELIVPDGAYRVFAYGDSDRDGLPDRSDPAALLTTQIEVAGQGMVTMLDLALSASEFDAMRAALPAHPTPPRMHSTQVGALADLQSPALSAQSGHDAYWAPLIWFKQYGGNIYFLEPYDPERTPVLFVHGAAGSAQDWRYFLEHLDRSRYQAWLFEYPSGAALDSMAHLLYWKLLNLQLRYHFERLHIVAHSMGGLVVRRFLLDQGPQFPQVSQFVSLSTPWGGEASAVLGVEHSPAVVPSWRDMQPEGEFLSRLYQRPLPATVRHTLLFGHRGGYNLLRPTTDGTVTLASQLRPAAQSEAQLVMGFDEDHTSILSAAPVFEQVMRMLDRTGDSSDSSGQVHISLAFDTEVSTRSAAASTLVLTPARTDMTVRSPLVFLVSADETELELGPIPAGDYAAQLIVPAFRSAPRELPVAISPNAPSRVAFELAPQGVLSGYVGAPGNALEHPAGSYRPPEETVRIERILLSGAGVAREVVPRHAGAADFLSSYAEGRDDAIGAFFSFVGLPAGDYALTIVAEGYQPHVSRHRVELGVATPSAPVVLTPKR